MAQGEPGVMPQHARAAPLHDQLYLFAHGRGIAVDVAVGTGGFVAVAIAAAPQALVGEGLQLLAVAAGGILMMVVAVEADHGADRLLFPLEPGVLGCLAGTGLAHGIGVMDFKIGAVDRDVTVSLKKV